MRRLLVVSLLIASMSVAACRSSDDDNNNNGGPDGGNDTPDAAVGGDTSIYDLQSDTMPAGTAANLLGVVVIAIDSFGGRQAGVYVMEPEGGPFSGVLVFTNSAGSIQVGDLVNVTGGVKDEFALNEDETGRTLTELSPPEGGSITITKVGDGTVPEPQVVNPWELAASDEEAEKWEGVLVRFEGARVFFSPSNVSSSDETLKEMTVTGPFPVSSALTDLADSISQGDCYSSITGIGDYFFSYKILPRSAGDLVAGSDGDCLPVEDTLELCEDESDNDYNGFSDCLDFGCQGILSSCFTDASVTDLQDGTLDSDADPSVLVALDDVTVTAKTFNQKSIWVQDGTTAAGFNGVYVFRSSGQPDLDMAIDIGSTVDVTGALVEFDGVTEVINVTITDIKTGTAPTPVDVTIADLNSMVDGEQYEGVLVTLDNLSVTNQDLGNNKWSISQGAQTMIIDDNIFRIASVPAVDSCLTSVTGIMHYNSFDDHLVLLPRSDADFNLTAGTCP